MPQLIPISVPGTLGNVVGAGSDGVLHGILTDADPTYGLLKSQAVAGLCFADDGGTYVNYDSELGENTGDDVPLLPATPAQHDATYFGHASYTFSRLDLNITTQGVGTWTITWEYWTGSAWATLTVTDNTTGFTATTGWKSVTFTAPSDWAKCTVDSVNAYWIRARVSAYTAVTTQPLAGQGYFVTSTPSWTDDTTDLTDAGTGDVDLLPAYPIVGDGFYIGYSEPFCKVNATYSQARTGTATVTWKYWNGTTWTALSTIEDDTAGWATSAGTLLVHFVPPSDWVACTTSNGPNGKAGYFVVAELTALTSYTQQPLGTRAYVLPVTTGATGLPAPFRGTVSKVTMNAATISGSAANSVFLLINATKGTWASFTWTKQVAMVVATISLAMDEGDNLILVQVTEDGSTEFAATQFTFQAA